MHLYEYQGKSILSGHGIHVPYGILVDNESAIEKALRSIETDRAVIKAQVHAGGRGKSGGIKIVDSLTDGINAAKAMLNSRLITPQTDAEGVLVSSVYVEACSDIAREFYVSFLLDRASSSMLCMTSKHGGMDIEEVALHHPESLYQIKVNPITGLVDADISVIASLLEIPNPAMSVFSQTLKKLSRLFVTEDMMLLEINPLILTGNFDIVALDAKMTLDEKALYRHPHWNTYFETQVKDAREIEAQSHGLSYVALDGNIGCLVNGAGLAMATMDAIALEGGKPANFLDVGGSASQSQIEAALSILLKDPKVEGIFVNIFGGIMQCDTIASAIVSAANKLHIALPIVVRLEGNRKEVGECIIDQARGSLKIISVDSLDEGAKTMVAIINQDDAFEDKEVTR